MIMMKSEFARRCNVDRSRVSQWLRAGQIDGAAVVGTGRSAKLDAGPALAQLKLRLATDERFGLNGLNTGILDWDPDEVEADDEDDDLAEVERHRGIKVDLADVERRTDDVWVLTDLHVQAALEPYGEALAAYMAIRPKLAAIKDGRG